MDQRLPSVNATSITSPLKRGLVGTGVVCSAAFAMTWLAGIGAGWEWRSSDSLGSCHRRGPWHASGRAATRLGLLRCHVLTLTRPGIRVILPAKKVTPT
jgi:hypothetical protein